MRPLSRLSLCALLPVLALAACAGADQGAPPGPAAALAAPPPAAPAAKKTARRVPPRDTAKAADKPAESPAAAAAPAAETIPEADLSLVVGRREDEVVKLLGAPSRLSEAPPARSLLFLAEGCSLELFAFPDMTQGGFRVLEAKAGGPLTGPQCLARLRAANGQLG